MINYGFCWDNVPYEVECLASDAVSHPERVPTAIRILEFAKQRAANGEVAEFLEGLTDETPGLPDDLDAAIWEFPTLPELAYYLYAMEEIAGTLKWYQEKIAAAVDMVVNASGALVNFDAAVELMDDEIRERVHDQIAPCSDQEFFTAYEAAHAEKFGEDWGLSGPNPVY